MFVFDLACRISSSICWIICWTWWGLSAECDMGVADVPPLAQMAGAKGGSSVGSVPPHPDGRCYRGVLTCIAVPGAL